ncbi:MAG: LysR family glycine cleavage system transcriptional activator [Arenicella sp.]|jgi:LysR family glycine cleavage system transcriptional activator
MTLSPAARRLPSLNALRVFEAAARHLSFKAAAEELSVSQSAVSHQIKALEQSLSVALFLRHPREVELTLRGQLYYPIVRDALDSIADGTEMMLNKTSNTVLTVQVYSTFTIRWLLPRLDRFNTQHPNIQVRLHTSQTNTDFHHDAVDAAILIGRANNSRLHYDHLFDSEMFPVCSPEYLHKHGPIKSPSDLKSHPLLQVFPSPDDWPNWMAAMQVEPLQYDPRLQMKMESYNDALASAVQGFGIALGQQPYMTKDIEAGSLIEIFPGQRICNPNHWFLACRVEKTAATKIQSFRTWLIEEIHADPSIRPIATRLQQTQNG